jgi:predicted Zn-dependent peptidase
MKTQFIYLFALSLFVISSCSTKQTGTQTMTKTFDRNEQPKPGPAPKINLGKPQTFSLDNGLKVLVVENHKLPRASATLTIDNDPLFEGEKTGVSHLLASLLGSGTTSISKDDFNEKVDFLGARVYYGSTSARMSSLSKFFPEVFTLMADGAQNPIFNQEEFDKEVAKTIDGIKSGEKSVQTIASRVENVLAYGRNHPYGEFSTIESIKALKLQDVKNLYNTYYKPNNSYLVIVGDVNFEEIKSLVTKNFGNWKKGELPNYTFPKVENVAQTEIDFIDMPNASQTQVSVISTTNLKMNDPDYHAVLVANQILGGDFNSYLNMNLREAHGFTYGARSSLRPNKFISRFNMSTQVRNDVADSTVVEMFKELNKIRSEKVTAENLKNVKAGYAGKFVMAVEKPETVARYALNIEKNNLPANFYETYLEKINTVSIEDVQRVAQKYFNKDNARIVVTSKGIDVLPALEKLGYKINYFNKEGNPTTKPMMPSAVSNDITPKSVLEKYFTAVGGKDKLTALKSIEQTYEMTMQGMPLTQTFKMQNPNMLYIETNMMGQTAFKMVFDGTEGYMEQMGAKMPMPDDQLAKMKSKKGLIDELYLLDESKKVSFDGVISIDGKETYKMIVINGDEKEIKYFEVESGLLVKSEKSAKDPATGGEIMIPTSYLDYKAVDGILFPHKITTKAMGQDMEMILSKIELNKQFPEGTFK